MKIEIASAVALVSCVISLITVFHNLSKDTMDDKKGETQILMKLSVKLDTICEAITDIRAEIRASNLQINEMSKTQIKHDEKLKNLEHRIKDLEKGVEK